MRAPVACILAFVLLPGCGDTPSGVEPRALAADRLGACAESGDIDGPDAGKFVSMPGAWVRVDAIDAMDAGTRTRDFGGSYAVVGGDEPMTRALGTAPETLRMHGSIASAAAEALELGASVHVHTGVIDDPRHVAFGLAIKGNEFAFLGDCQNRLLTQPLGRRLGPNAAERLASLVGATSPDLRRALVPTAAPPTGEPVLNPEVTSPDVLARLETGLLTLADVPDSWHGAHTLCTHIRAGWSDCVDLSTSSTAAISVNYYFDLADPTVEVWVLDADGTLTQPLVRLATLDLATLADRDRIDLDKPGVNIVLNLSSNPSLAEVLADEEKASGAIERVRLTRD